MPNYLEYQKSISKELLSIKGRLRNFIDDHHWPEDGRYKEIILTDILRKHLPMLATKLYPLLPTTPGTANLTNFPKRKTPQSATFQSLYINKNERTLFPRFVVVGFLYSFCSSRQDFQIFFAHTVKHSIELTAARGFLLFPFREKELVY